jgi:hypothetical protein
MKTLVPALRSDDTVTVHATGSRYYGRGGHVVSQDEPAGYSVALFGERRGTPPLHFEASEIEADVYDAAEMDTPAAARVGSWVLYRPWYQFTTGRSPLVATGIEGTWPESADAQQVADAMLAAYASSADRADWAVKVFGADGKLRAWADRDGGQR